MSVRKTLWLYVGAGTVSGTAVGGGIGWLGSYLSSDARIAAGTGAALVAVALGAAVVSRRLEGAPLQCDRETPQRWVTKGALRWSLQNGVALGCGALSRLGFPLWYVLPAGCLLLGSPVGGAILWGLYGLVRTATAGVLWSAATRRHRPAPWSGDVLAKREIAERVSGFYLLLLGLTALIVVGA